MVILENSSQSGNYGSQTTSNGNIGGKPPGVFMKAGRAKVLFLKEESKIKRRFLLLLLFVYYGSKISIIVRACRKR